MCFLIVSGGILTFSLYQRRIASEAVMYQSNSEGYYSELQNIEDTVYLAEQQASGEVDAYQQYTKAKNNWTTDPDGTVWYQGKHYRRNSYVKAVLAMGVDRKDEMSEEAVTDYYGTGNADAMFVLAQDTARDKIRILMLPRDAIVEMDLYDLDGSFQGTALQNLTLAWSYGDGGNLSAENAVKTVSNMLCDLTIDHYAATNMAMLGQVNDAVDGVTVTIPNDELQKRVPEWTRGTTVTLHGEEAETFLRYRDKNMDNAASFRMQQHRAYILGFYDAVKRKSASDSNIVTELYDLVQGNMITDLNKGEFLKLGMDGLNSQGGLTSEDIISLPGLGVPADENWPYDRVFVDYASAIPIILDFFYREI